MPVSYFIIWWFYKYKKNGFSENCFIGLPPNWFFLYFSYWTVHLKNVPFSFLYINIRKEYLTITTRQPYWDIMFNSLLTTTSNAFRSMDTPTIPLEALSESPPTEIKVLNSDRRRREWACSLICITFRPKSIWIIIIINALSNGRQYR